MSNSITNVAVIGTGVIGAGWIIRALAHNKKVTAYDKDIKLEKKLSSRVIEGTRQQAKEKSVAMISNVRDEYLVNLQKLRKKFEKKIR